MGHNKRFNLIQAQEIARIKRDHHDYVPAPAPKSKCPNVIIRRRAGEEDERITRKRKRSSK